MGKREPSVSDTLSFDEKLSLIRALWPLGDRAIEFLDALKAKGFAAFAPREAWLESFAQNGQEVSDHRDYIREQAKYALGLQLADFDPDAYREFGAPPGLRRLREARDQKNGVPESLLRAKYSEGECLWRAEIDLCRRRTDDSIRSAARARLDKAERDALRAEAAAHASDLSRRYTMLTIVFRDRIAFCKAALSRALEPLGFQGDRKRSTSIAPVFSKPITAMWDLCFELIPDKIFIDAGSGRFDLRLSLRPRRDHRKFHAIDHLEIRYFDILESLCAYRYFKSIAELDIIVQARTYLYELMAPQLEAALRNGLDRSS